MVHEHRRSVLGNYCIRASRDSRSDLNGMKRIPAPAAHWVGGEITENTIPQVLVSEINPYT